MRARKQVPARQDVDREGLRGPGEGSACKLAPEQVLEEHPGILGAAPAGAIVQTG